MQTIFIFTHLIMIGAITLLLYIAFDSEPEAIWIAAPARLTWMSYLLSRCKALGCSMKARGVVLTGQICRWKATDRPNRRSSQSI
jgi:hypothetical protein